MQFLQMRRASIGGSDSAGVPCPRLTNPMRQRGNMPTACDLSSVPRRGFGLLNSSKKAATVASRVARLSSATFCFTVFLFADGRYANTPIRRPDPWHRFRWKSDGRHFRAGRSIRRHD